MKTRNIYALTSLAILGLAAFTMPSANAIEATGKGTIIAGISIVKDSETTTLNFGKIVASDSAGTVTINPQTGARSATGGAVLDTSDPGSPAAFRITGENSKNFTVTLPNNFILTGPGANMTVSNLTCSINSNGNSTSGTINSSTPMKVGGTLAVAAMQGSGVYTGTFNVSVAYN